MPAWGDDYNGKKGSSFPHWKSNMNMFHGRFSQNKMYDFLKSQRIKDLVEPRTSFLTENSKIRQDTRSPSMLA